MAFKTIVDLSADTVISLGGRNKKTGKDNPNSIEGYYLGKREVADKKKKSGLSYIYTFQTSKGNVGVWGKTDLDRKLSSAVPGQMLRVSFDRMVPTPNGEMYKYKVEFDDTNTIEVSGSDQESNYPETGGVAGLDEEDQGRSEPSYDEDDLTDDLVEASAPLVASKAKMSVQDIINAAKAKQKR